MPVSGVAALTAPSREANDVPLPTSPLIGIVMTSARTVPAPSSAVFVVPSAPLPRSV